MSGVYNWVGFLALAAMALAVGAAIAGRRRISTTLVTSALLVRVFGSFARFEVLMGFYDGVGDAAVYFQKGMTLARLAWSFDLPILTFWVWSDRGRWWGTPFMEKLSGLALTLLGPTMRGEFLAFALLSFLGLVACTEAVRRVQPGYVVPYARYVWFWPSLWFWPASVGKESVVVLAMGLVTLGYTGRDGKANWLMYLCGLGLAFAIRPHVAAVLALATLAAYWLGSWKRVTFRRLLETVLAIVLAVVALYGMRAQFGLQDADLEGVREFVEFRSEQTLVGGSSIGSVPLNGGGVILAFVNIWMRPFPWDVHNMTSLIAALEILALWVVIIRQRRHLRFAFTSWRHHRLLRFALPLLFGYTLMIGLAFGNLGIIARQRAPLFPFIFMLLFAVPQGYRALRRPRAATAGGATLPVPPTSVSRPTKTPDPVRAEDEPVKPLLPEGEAPL